MNRRQLFVLIATILGSSVVLLDSTIVNLALPKIGRGLGVGYSDFQWIVDGYTLSLSALILLGGSLGDIFGRKKIYFIGLIGFGVASVLCAASPNAIVLITTRIVQGIFGALLVPGGLSIINTNFDRHLRSQAIGKWTAFTSGAVLIGPLIGGTILDIASWRWIFLINVPLIVLCLLIGLPSITESHDSRPRKVDVKGALFAVLALSGITYGLIQGPAYHWHIDATVSLIAGIVFVVLFLWAEDRGMDPMIELSLFKSRNFLGSNIMTFAMYGALSGYMFSLIIYLQTKMGYSSLNAGFSMMPVGILMFLFAGRVGKLSAKFGPRLFMTFGPIISSLGMLYLFFLHPGDHYFTSVLPGIILFGIGLVLMVAPLTTTVMTSVDESSSGIASGINNAISRVAGLIVVALLGLLGAKYAYKFGLGLSACLALSAGLISFAMIRNKVLGKKPKAVTTR